MPASGGDLLLTTSAAADLLGVHPSTVKRWSDEGRLSPEKTRGGHRRLHLDDVLSTARSGRRSTFLDVFHPWEANVWLAMREASDRGGSFRRLHSLALSWLYRGEVDLLGHLFFQAGRREDITFSRFLDGGIRDFMILVGEEWREGRLQIGEEHMATQVIQEALLRLRTGWDRHPLEANGVGDAPVAVVGCMEGDQHDLGALAIRVLLEREGWRVYYLGPSVPPEEFAAIQQGQVADLVCISFSSNHRLPDLKRALRVLTEFFRPQFPYSLAVGGTVPLTDDDDLPLEPFRDFILAHSAEEFLPWVRSIASSPGDDVSRPEEMRS